MTFWHKKYLIPLAAVILLPPALCAWLFITLDNLRPVYIASALIVLIPIQLAALILFGKHFSSRKKQSVELLHNEHKSLTKQAKLYALGEVSTGLNHEIANPLVFILGATDILSRRNQKNALTSDTLEKNLQKIKHHAKRIEKVLKSFRAISRSSTDDPLEETSFKDIFEDTAGLIETRFKNSAIDFQLVEDNLDHIIRCRSSEIVQVLVNLLLNAVDAVKGQQEKWVKLDVAEFSNQLVIRVIDSGPGISKEMKQKILQPGFTTKTGSDGTGMGLAICKEIIEIHGGQFYIDSTVENTCFKIILPVIKRKEMKLSA